MSSVSIPRPRRRRSSESGPALFRSLASTIQLLRWLLFGLVALYLCSGITRIAPNEDALVYQFGTLKREVHPPGLLLALPAPIARVVKVPTRTQHELFLNAWSPDENATGASAAPRLNSSSASSTANPATLAVLGIAAPSTSTVPVGTALHPVFDGYTLTGDANVVQARLTVRYRITDPFAYVVNVRPATADILIESAVFDAATHLLAATKVDDALGAALAALGRGIRDAAQPRINQLHFGVELVVVEVNALTPPQAAVAAFSEVTNAQVESRTALEQARTYRAQVLPKAESDGYRLRQQATADGRQLVARATAEVASFRALLMEYQRAPALVATRLRAEMLEQTLSRVKTKTVLPAGNGHLNLFVRDSK